jgi:hypothetical protein
MKMIWQAMACGIDADAGSRGREIPRFGLLEGVHVGMVIAWECDMSCLGEVVGANGIKLERTAIVML